MQNKLEIGTVLQHTFIVQDDDIARFNGKVIHHVCSTFALAREAELAGRAFVLLLKNEMEEGIGTFVNIAHFAPAFIGDSIIFTATFKGYNEKREMVVDIEARVQDKLIISGSTGQKVMMKEKINKIFTPPNDQ
jgi:fluoroacetyl-CoA thioesterase